MARRRSAEPVLPDVRAAMAAKYCSLIDRYGGPDGIGVSSWERRVEELEAGVPLVLWGWELPRGTLPPGHANDEYRLEADDTLTLVQRWHDRDGTVRWRPVP